MTPLLELLQPDVHCKGTDYTVDTVPERETVLALRRAHRHRRRSEGPLHARSVCARIAGRAMRRGGCRPSAVLIVRMGALGDIVHALPAAAALRGPSRRRGRLAGRRPLRGGCAPTAAIAGDGRATDAGADLRVRFAGCGMDVGGPHCGAGATRRRSICRA